VDLNTSQTTLAGTHLNLCAALSKIDKHDKAVQHALCALELMSQCVSETSIIGSDEDYCVLALAYHNVATERDHLGQYDQAASMYQTGYQTAARLLGKSHPLTSALGQNSEAVMVKIKEAARLKLGKKRTLQRETSPIDYEEALAHEIHEASGSMTLPAIGQASQAKTPDRQAKLRRSLCKAAARLVSDAGAQPDNQEWIQSEEQAWSSFAKKTLQGLEDSRAVLRPGQSSGLVSRPVSAGAAGLAARQVEPEDKFASLAHVSAIEVDFGMQPLATVALDKLQQEHFRIAMPQVCDMGDYRLLAPPAQYTVKKTPFRQCLDDNPHALMDIIDASEGAVGTMRSATDFRPNRSVSRSSRTARLVRRTGVFNSTVHRDRVQEEWEKRRDPKSGGGGVSLSIQKMAAERIQKVWRNWYEYCQQNSEWMTITWICATMIQSHWRSYHVRRVKMDRSASTIQRHARGKLVRSILRKHKAAVTIQKRMVGILTRAKLRQLHEAVIKIQRIVRGGLTRIAFRKHKVWKIEVIKTIQTEIRRWQATRKVQQWREIALQNFQLMKAAVELQRFFRGHKARERVMQMQKEKMALYTQFDAAVKIQLLFRRKVAGKVIELKRTELLKEMDKAAIFMQKLWKGKNAMKQYLSLKKEFESVTDDIVTIQRYMRGCLCRNRMWREAVRAEEEIWAAVTIQRLWKGYLGRVRWEATYERVWRREMSAAWIQRHVRGCLARLQVTRQCKQIRRQEFEHARNRFRAAQKIQARARGIITRRIQKERRQRVAKAATAIQRHQRGGELRTRLWRQIRSQRASMIQALVRGAMVRARASNLAHKIVFIQCFYRNWLRKPELIREQQFARKKDRGEKAKKIQRTARDYLSRQRISRIIALTTGTGSPIPM